MQLLNFKFQLNQALSLITNDDQIIVKIYLNFYLFIARLSLDMIHHSLLMFYSGINFGFIPS